jgi:hypothetical protein
MDYEDINDDADLRRDPLLTAAAGKEDALEAERRCTEDSRSACASASTLKRL